jgi:hypothetical protein
MAMKAPWNCNSLRSSTECHREGGGGDRREGGPVMVCRRMAPPSVLAEEGSGSHSSTVKLVMIWILGERAARWWRTFEARKPSLRWMMVT